MIGATNDIYTGGTSDCLSLLFGVSILNKSSLPLKIKGRNRFDISSLRLYIKYSGIFHDVLMFGLQHIHKQGSELLHLKILYSQFVLHLL